MTGTTESFRERTAFEDPTDREHHAETPPSAMNPEGRGTRYKSLTAFHDLHPITTPSAHPRRRHEV